MSPHHTRRALLKTVGAGGIGLGVVGTTGARGMTFRQQLRDVRAATRKYRDPAVAIADGFTPGVNSCGGGYHYDQLGRRTTGTADLLEPEVILYGVDARGELVLAGVEYEVRQDLRDLPESVPPDIFADEGERLKVSEAEAWRLVGPVGDLGKIWALHVWVHLGNPDGLFSACQPTRLFRQPGCDPNALCGGSR